MNQNEDRPKRPKIATVANIYQRRSHTEKIIDRILDGYGWNGIYHHPCWMWCRCVSIKLAQTI
jgi:hypothetical protein